MEKQGIFVLKGKVIREVSDNIMKNVNELLSNISKVSNINFKIKNNKGDIYTSPDFYIKTIYVEKTFKIYEEEFTIRLCKEDENVLPLLIDSIVKDIKYDINKRRNIIKDIIQDKDVKEEYIKDAYSFLMNKFSVILINVNKSVKESITLLQDGYNDENIVIVNYKKNILIIGMLEDVYEHALSIKETLEYNLEDSFLISFGAVDGYKNLSKLVKHCEKKIELAKKFGINNEILSETSLIFEDIVDSIDNDMKNRLIEEFDSGFKKLDNEMMKTIEVFFNCGLNITESAKNLYIHRNTLIYRIEKIQKCTGFDIKDFNMASMFKILFLLWKEK